jgi:Secretion system C-terminal sorting domain
MKQPDRSRREKICRQTKQSHCSENQQLVQNEMVNRHIRSLYSKIIISLVATILFGQLAFSQDLLWQKRYGGVYNDDGFAVAAIVGGYVLAGSTYSFGNGDFDLYVVRLDTTGEVLWSKTFGDTLGDYGYGIATTATGGFVIAGSTIKNGLSDVFVVCIDSAGQELWRKSFGGSGSDEGRSIQKTQDGGFVICGTSSSSGAGYSDLYLLKINANGDSLWARTYGGAGGESGMSVNEAQDGSLIAVGSTGSFGQGYSSLYAVHTSANGDPLWATTYGGPNSDFGSSVDEALDGGFIFAGATASATVGYSDVYLVKTNSSGIVEWSQTYGGAKDDRGYCVQATDDGGYIVAATQEGTSSRQIDAYLIKTDLTGAVQWSQVYGGEKSDYCRSIIRDQNKHFIAFGYSYSFSVGGSDLYLLKVRGDMATPVYERPSATLPDGFALLQNYPNPFNATTRIEFSTPRRSHVALDIFNVLGERVTRLVDNIISAGNWGTEWDGRNTAGQNVASGIYFYRVVTDFGQVTRKMVLLK